MIFAQLFRVMRARLTLILAILAVTVASAAVASFVMSKRYVATASLVVNIPASDPISGSATYLPGSVSGLLATQVDLIKSDRVIQRAIANLGLEREQALMDEFQASGGKGDFRRWIGAKILQELSVEAARESSFINLTYESKNPEFAARVTNGVAQAFVEATLELKTEPAKNYSALFETQAKQYRQELEQAQNKLNQFQQQSGIMASDERYDVENTRLQELSSQLVALQGLATESRSRQNSAQRAGRDTLPEVVANPLLQTLKGELVRTEARYQELASRLGPNHPQMQAATAEVENLKHRIDSESQRVAGSISQGNAINADREAQIRAAYEAQRGKVQQLRRQRDQLTLLQRDVDAAQKSYELLTTRLTQTNLEGAARMSNISIASPAVVPSQPSRPQPVLNIVLGAVFGLLLGLLAAMTIESVQRPLRTSNDLLHASGVPVLAVLPSATSRRPQRLIGSTGPSVGNSTLRLGN